MTQQYWIGEFYVDLSRNQITDGNEVITLAPKALSVLTALAQQQGHVISQDTLLDKVWPDTIVSPNTLQRCIAQLRKALGDDGKEQHIIKTHAKQGYSLECEVRWQTQPQSATPAQHKAATQPEPGHAPAPTQIRSRAQFGFALFAAAFFIVGLAASVLFEPSSSEQLTISEFRPLTATDNLEVAGVYSPDGEYIVFHRYSTELCRNNIWAKRIDTQQEFRLTNNLDINGQHQFSPDGKMLAFVQTSTCVQPVTQKLCYHLMTLDFNKALQTPQTPARVLECKNSQIREPQWLDSEHIALLQKTNERWKLIRYSMTDNTSAPLYEVSDGDIISYDYSRKDGLLAVVRLGEGEHYYLDMLRPDGTQVSSHRIHYPNTIARFRPIYPNFSPYENQLAFSTGRQLYTLTYQGQVSPVTLPVDEPMGSPVFHPDGNRMLVIKGQYDSDILSLPFGHDASLQTSQAMIFERSTKEESNAIFQPGGDLLAFNSARSGQMQIWLSDGQVPRQLSNFPMDTFLYETHWSADGTELLTNADKALVKFSLDGTAHAITLAHPIEQLFYWDSRAQTALAQLKINGVLTFAELDLTNSAIRVLNDHEVTWALKTSNGTLIYTDHMDRFWRSGPVEDELIEPLLDQGSERRFTAFGNILYGINESAQLWSYDLHSGDFEILTTVANDIVRISAVNDEQILLIKQLTSRKEVVELLLGD
ncbi:winged helix-turn-helix domain-containing protein [Pseudoalteromonas sp. OOF1S-7]|uniref:winged helix-turn-helix domain-containing protein n=1 Tax=Pseudoalteromonas sp. OOF1S-7 TaxID=2917757 RepID=UPI001EF5AD4A|nr:winged helix-turn-helix domain-containing protein [Pseudoalteromonas sp. OOF1S-7]MCG7535734.1 winged helix-turn-helix domain-containing protein [Pseudoalteromonas sp. OOF1S-7]